MSIVGFYLTFNNNNVLAKANLTWGEGNLLIAVTAIKGFPHFAICFRS
jgi:hypothetical protein